MSALQISLISSQDGLHQSCHRVAPKNGCRRDKTREKIMKSIRNVYKIVLFFRKYHFNELILNRTRADASDGDVLAEHPNQLAAKVKILGDLLSEEAVQNRGAVVDHLERR